MSGEMRERAERFWAEWMLTTETVIGIPVTDGIKRLMIAFAVGFAEHETAALEPEVK